jgi:hypothetical protein
VLGGVRGARGAALGRALHMVSAPIDNRVALWITMELCVHKRESRRRTRCVPM